MFSGWNRNFIAIFVLLSIGVFCTRAQSDPAVKFLLYTPINPAHAVELPSDTTNISVIPFNPRWPTVVFIHGFQSDQTVINLYRDTYLLKRSYNFIAVDWVRNVEFTLSLSQKVLYKLTGYANIPLRVCRSIPLVHTII